MSKIEVSAAPETTEDAEQLTTQLQNERSRFKDAATRVFGDSKAMAQRWGRQGLRAAEGLAGSTRGHIENDPIRTAAISFVIGMTLGALIGRYASRHQI